jgi:hypothetical protein
VQELVGPDAEDEFDAAVRDALSAGRRQAVLLQAVGARVTDALADAGIRCALLKGPQLGEAIFGDPGRRLSGDVDLLVAPEQLCLAVECVRQLGYRAPEDRLQADGLPVLHFALAHAEEALPPVELHWRVHWYERRFAQERLLPSLLEDSIVGWRPAPADELAALLLFYARDGFIDLRLASDLSAWWDAHGGQLPQGALAEHLESFPALARALSTAALVASAVVGLPARELFGESPSIDVRARVAARLANPNPRMSTRQLYADRGLIDGLLMPSGEFPRFVRRQVFPAPEVLATRAQSSTHRLRAALGDRGRLLLRCGILGRYGLTMTRLVRASETARLT